MLPAAFVNWHRARQFLFWSLVTVLTVNIARFAYFSLVSSHIRSYEKYVPKNRFPV